MDSDAQKAESSESGEGGGIRLGIDTVEGMTKRLETFYQVLGSTQLTAQEASQLLDAVARLRLRIQSRVRIPERTQ